MRSSNSRLVGAVLLALVFGLAVVAQTDSSGRGFDVSRMDRAASACTDFYQFANGNWLKSTDIPAAFSTWGSFDILAENNRKTLHEILEEAARKTGAAKGSA